MEANVNQLNTIDEFIYSPQFQNVSVTDTSIYKYETITCTTGDYSPGVNDIFQWLKDNLPVINASETTFTLENVMLADSGTYVCSITNPLFPDLNFSSDTCILKVLIPVGIEENTIRFDVYPNPASDKIYVDTKNESIDLKVFSLTGKLILEKNNFKSDWINIEELNKGIYLFKVKSSTDKTRIKKVVFR